MATINPQTGKPYPAGTAKVTHDLGDNAMEPWKDTWDAATGKVKYEPDYHYINPNDPHSVMSSGARQILESRGMLQQNALQPGQQLTQQLQLAAQGQGPSAAQAQLQQATDQNLRNQLALAASARGGITQQAAARRQAMTNAAAQQGEANAQSVALAAREQQAARDSLGQHLGTQGGLMLQQQRADFELAKQNQDYMLANQQMRMDAAKQSAAGKKDAVGGLLQSGGALLAAVSDIRAKEDIKPAFSWDPAANPNQASPMMQVAARQQAGAAPQIEQGGGMTAGNMGGVMSILGGALSDRESKREITNLRAALAAATGQADKVRDAHVEYPPLSSAAGSRAAFAPVDPYQYRYKPEEAARMGEDTEPRLGVMAQDLEQSPYLRSAVVRDESGRLGIDGSRGLSAALAAAAGLDKRLKALEVQYPQAQPSMLARAAGGAR